MWIVVGGGGGWFEFEGCFGKLRVGHFFPLRNAGASWNFGVSAVVVAVAGGRRRRRMRRRTVVMRWIDGGIATATETL